MADNKKYYYLKLKDNFYESEQMIILQNMQDGYLYSDILMKLYLRSLKTNGKLMFNNVIPYTPSVLAQVVRHQIGTVERAMKIFQELGLIEILDNGAIYMLDIQNFIGKSSTEADRIRKFRKKISDEKSFVQMYDKCTPEIEIEKEIDIEIEKEPTNNIDIYDYIEKNFGILISGSNFENVGCWLEEFNEDILKYAVDICVANGKRTIKYWEGILKTWKGLNFTSINDIKENEEKRKVKSIQNLPEWFEKEIEEEKLNDTEKKELEEIMKNYR